MESNRPASNETPPPARTPRNGPPERPRPGRFARLVVGVLLLLILNSAYLYVFDSPTFFYLFNIGFHVVGGAGLALVAVFWVLPKVMRAARGQDGWRVVWLRVATLLCLAGIGTGFALMVTGATRPMAPLLYTHITACITGLGAIGMYLRALYVDRRAVEGDGYWWQRTRTAWQIAAIALPGILLLGVAQSRAAAPVVNPEWAPESMEDETRDPRLHPSSMQIKGAEWMPDDFFTETASASCGEAGCHSDIYEQWYGSAHHFSSFNNQWYRKSIEYMQEVQVEEALRRGLPKEEGLKASQWCAGCHDPSVLLTGRWTKDSIVNQLSEAKRDILTDPKKLERLHSGLGCLSCHAAVHVDGTMGQGGLVLEYPALHKYAENPSPLVKKIHNYLISLDPGPHRKLFLKPLHTDATADFCSSCHKVHLDRPVNNYRWIRGFNDYDPWQMSGVSGQGARAFYYPKDSKKCVDCHMPPVKSTDKGNIKGYVHSHRFPGANTAIAVANKDHTQLEETIKFLKDKVVTVDIFGLRRGGAVRVEQNAGLDSGAPRAASLMGDAGDAGGGAGGVGLVLDNTKLTAPLGAVPAVLKRGESVGVEVVVRTRGMGHAFPGGTIDAFDVWVEFQAFDENGRMLMWSGSVASKGEGRNGEVDPSAHFYRALLVDENGNPINKRNAWAARALVYSNVIPPGAADAVHYRLYIPADCGDKVTLRAKVNYRKFSYYYNKFAYAGRRDPKKPGPFTLDFDDGNFLFDADTADVSGDIKEIPEIPIVVMAETEIELPVTSGAVPEAVLGTEQDTWERWNDYGIGLLRQRDFKGAGRAFRNVLLARPDYGDGHVHLGQTLLDDGQVREALMELERAVSMAKVRSQQGKAYFHYARALRESGRLAEAVHFFRECSRLFPKDREVSNQLGLALINSGDYAGAETAFRRTLKVDPEDVTANFNLIKAYNGLRSQAEEEKRNLLDPSTANRETPRTPPTSRLARMWFGVRANAMTRVDPSNRRAQVAGIDARIGRYTASRDRAERLYNRFRADEASQERTAIFKRLNPHDNNEAQLVHEHE
jgi:tetratricopeptide (TPR) repeat protein